MGRVVLVTGVSRDLAARCARDLSARPGVEVVGVDVTPPRFDLGRARYVRADIRNPVVARVLIDHRVDTVVHLAITASAALAGGRTAMKDQNVIGTLQLLAASQRTDTFARLVVQSAADVYGSSPRDPARFTEDLAARVAPRSGLGKDAVEIENYVRALARRRPDVAVATLRLGAPMGAGVDTPLSRYLTLPAVPKVAGFDARLQFLHPGDAVAALVATALADWRGTFNVAAPDVVTLSQAAALLGRPTLPVPQAVAPSVAALGRRLRLADLTADELDTVTWGRVMDTASFVATSGLRPTVSSREALVELGTVVAPGPVDRLVADARLAGLASRLGRVPGPVRG